MVRVQIYLMVWTNFRYNYKVFINCKIINFCKISELEMLIMVFGPRIASLKSKVNHKTLDLKLFFCVKLFFIDSLQLEF